ncbi:MAG TPA: integrase arm-type DNA-binding domain-containing protein [Rhizomicrobium sp.]|jgi:integrase|nr:integrase arm-type DNA-binding domain-containing protein [Rhizomicrobium sp.]
MAKKINRLTVRGVVSRQELGLCADGNNLWLRVAPGGSKSWMFRFMLFGRSRMMGLGSVTDVTLAEARNLALEARKLLKQGIDPIDERRRLRQNEQKALAQPPTFRECAEQYIAAHRRTWSNEKHTDQWRSTLSKYVYPRIGSLPVADIDVKAVCGVLNPIWTLIPETARRIRARIERVLAWAATQDLRSIQNPAIWHGNLINVLSSPSRQQKHFKALPYLHIAEFMKDLRDQNGLGPRALELCILTATRTQEVLGARWAEVDLQESLWTVPAHRMKGKKEHVIPLSEPACLLLKELWLTKAGEFVFPGMKNGGPLSNMALSAVLRRMRVDVTAHGFRSTFRDWGADCTTYPNQVLEQALAHTISNKAEAAYRRGNMLRRRIGLMRCWGDYCAGSDPTDTESGQASRCNADQGKQLDTVSS